MNSGTFLVTTADDETATLRDVHTGQLLTVAGRSDLEASEVLEATLEPEPPLDIVYTVSEAESRRTIPVERSEMAPTTLERELAAGQDEGEITRHERAGDGEIHVLTVPEDGTERTATGVVDDQETVARAARLGVERVEVRTGEGVISVRYLPA